MTYKGEERRKISEVSDRPAEAGIKINNIISALILGVMAWVGVNIETMKRDLATVSTVTQLNKSDIYNNRKDIMSNKEEIGINRREIANIKEMIKE